MITPLLLSIFSLWLSPARHWTVGVFCIALAVTGVGAWVLRGSEEVKPSVSLLLFWSMMPGVLGAVACYIYGGFDSAIFSQAVHNIETSGRAFVSIAHGSDHMGVHFQPILYLLAGLHSWLPKTPIYLFLLACQLLSALMVPALIWIGPRRPLLSLGPVDTQPLLYFLGLSVLSYWGVSAAIRFDFHPETMGAFFSIAAVIALAQGREVLAWALLVLAAGCGELFCVTSLVMGATFAVLMKETDKIRWWHWLWIPGALVLGMRALDLYQSRGHVIFGRSQTFSVFSRYALGSSLGEIFRNIISQPLIALETIFGHSKGLFLLCLVTIFTGPLLCLVMREHRWSKHESPVSGVLVLVLGGLTALAAPLGKVLLGQAETYLTRSNHYIADMMPGLSLLLIAGYLVSLSPQRSWRRGLGAVAPVVLTLIIISVNTLPTAPDTRSGRELAALFVDRKEIYPRDLRTALRQIPVDASVYVNTLQVLNELSGRQRLYTSFSPKSLFNSDMMPDYAVLGWPPTHGYGQPSAEVFERSFKVVAEGVVESVYEGRSTRYQLVREFGARLPGHIWVWKRG